MLDFLAALAEGFIGWFTAGGATFVALVGGILPTLIVLLTGVNAVVKLIGQRRIDGLAEVAARPGFAYTPLRYLVLPVVSMFVLTNPMAYTMGRFLPERQKPAFYDAAVSFAHPITGIFPHANAGELFVFLGIAAGIETLGLNQTDLAVRYLLVGLVVIYMRGLVTEFISNLLFARRPARAEAAPTAGAGPAGGRPRPVRRAERQEGGGGTATATETGFGTALAGDRREGVGIDEGVDTRTGGQMDEALERAIDQDEQDGPGTGGVNR